MRRQEEDEEEDEEDEKVEEDWIGHFGGARLSLPATKVRGIPCTAPRHRALLQPTRQKPQPPSQGAPRV
eukprot:7847099-Pyramimonas_sp.AAC.1